MADIRVDSDEQKFEPMSQFEFFMSFYGLLLGLGVAQLLSGLANLIREKSSPKLGVLTPLFAAVALIEMVSSYIDAWENSVTLGSRSLSCRSQRSSA